MQIHFFIISLLITLPLLQALPSLNSSQLSSYDLSTLLDCESVSSFQTQLQAALTSYVYNENVLQSALDAINEAQTLLNQIISLENQNNNNTFLLSRTQSFKNAKRMKKSANLLQIQTKKIEICLDAVDNAYNLVSEDCQQDIDNLRTLFVTVKNNNGTLDVVGTCNQVLDLLEPIELAFTESLADNKNTVDALEIQETDVSTRKDELNC